MRGQFAAILFVALQTRAAEIDLGSTFKERDAPFAEGVPLDGE